MYYVPGTVSSRAHPAPLPAARHAPEVCSFLHTVVHTLIMLPIAHFSPRLFLGCTVSCNHFMSTAQVLDVLWSSFVAPRLGSVDATPLRSARCSRPPKPKPPRLHHHD
jgi:hypothetical protein